jgi:hypothetical protein
VTGSILAAFGLILMILFAADDFRVLIAGIAGGIFIIVGVVAVVLGIRGVLKTRSQDGPPPVREIDR